MGSRRIRSLKPEILSDAKMRGLRDRDWRLFVSLIVMSDDEGRFEADTAVVGPDVFGYAAAPSDVEAALFMLAELHLVELWTHAGLRYGRVTGWSRHQRIDKPSASSLPAPDAEGSVIITFDERSTNVPRMLDERSLRIGSDPDLDRTGSDRSPAAAGAAPTPAPPAAAPNAAPPNPGTTIDAGVADTKELGKDRRRTAQRPAPTPRALEVADYLLAAIASHCPGHRGTQATARKWATDIDLALRLDERTVDALRQVIDFAHRPPHRFWAHQILSGKKLRDKFDELSIDMHTAGRGPQKRAAAGNGNGHKGGGLSADDLWQRALDLERLEKGLLS